MLKVEIWGIPAGGLVSVQLTVIVPLAFGVTEPMTGAAGGTAVVPCTVGDQGDPSPPESFAFTAN